jgi:DNA-binding transcriptional regulator YiaG
MIKIAYARMDEGELISYRRMAGMSVEQFAAGLAVTPSQLVDMEAGREVIPARFDEDVIHLVENAISEMDDPGPLNC